MGSSRHPSKPIQNKHATVASSFPSTPPGHLTYAMPQVNPAGLLQPSFLLLTQAHYSELTDRVRLEIAKGPLAPNDVVWLGVHCQMEDGETVGCQVAWTPSEGFFLPGLVDTPLLTEAQAAARNKSGGFTLAHFIQAQRCLEVAPRSARHLYLQSAGTTVHLDRSRDITIRFFNGKEVVVSLAASNTIDDVRARIQELE